LFGAQSEELPAIFECYEPGKIIDENQDLNRVIKLIQSGHFNLCEPDIFQPILDAITNPHDPWLTAYDFASYIDTQFKVDQAYRNQSLWTEMSITNTASSGPFSSDRTISQYSKEIWNL